MRDERNQELERLEQELLGERFYQLAVRKDGYEGTFSFFESYLYVFHTKIAFLCIGLLYQEMHMIFI